MSYGSFAPRVSPSSLSLGGRIRRLFPPLLNLRKTRDFSCLLHKPERGCCWCQRREGGGGRSCSPRSGEKNAGLEIWRRRRTEQLSVRGREIWVRQSTMRNRAKYSHVQLHCLSIIRFWRGKNYDRKRQISRRIPRPSRSESRPGSPPSISSSSPFYQPSRQPFYPPLPLLFFAFP